MLTVGSPSASGIPTPYDPSTNTGDVLCTNGPSGYFSVANGNITGSTNCDGLAAIPDGVTSIGNNAFKNSNVSSVTIPSTMISIGASAFSASRLSTITFEGLSQLNSIGTFAFAYSRLANITIPNTVTSIGAYVFYFTYMTSVTIPSGLTSIPRGAFSFTPLRSITIPDSITTIETEAFWGNSQMTSLTVGINVTSIETDAFYATNSLTQYTYCGTNLTDTQLNSAGLAGKTRIYCVARPDAPTIGTATATGTTTATVAFTAPTSDGGSTVLSYTATSSPGSITATITQATSGTISITGLSASTSYTFTITALNSEGASLASAASNSITTAAALATGIAPLFTSASSYDGRFSVQIKDYDEAFTYAATSSAGQASINSTGLITVTGLLPDQSVTVSVTTTRTGYAPGSGSITGRAQVAPMLPGTKPVIETTETTIMCTIGSYSATPTSAAFSLFVDGKHVSTIFSALGDYLPDWIIPWATSSTITRTATLTSATWIIADAYKGKTITCATLAYSKNAIGFTATKALIAR